MVLLLLRVSDHSLLKSCVVISYFTSPRYRYSTTPRYVNKPADVGSGERSPMGTKSAAPAKSKISTFQNSPAPSVVWKDSSSSRPCKNQKHATKRKRFHAYEAPVTIRHTACSRRHTVLHNIWVRVLASRESAAHFVFLRPAPPSYMIYSARALYSYLNTYGIFNTECRR